jgi:predicted nucleic acid-binding protein
MKLFLDTNILMDIVFERPICLDVESKILQIAYKGQAKVAISSLSLVNTIYVAKKYGKTDENVKTTLFALSKLIDVIDIRGNDAVGTLVNGWKDYEDGLQYCCAVNYNADFIITRDKKGFLSSNLPVHTPQEFIDMIEDVDGK